MPHGNRATLTSATRAASTAHRSYPGHHSATLRLDSQGLQCREWRDSFHQRVCEADDQRLRSAARASMPRQTDEGKAPQ